MLPVIAVMVKLAPCPEIAILAVFRIVIQVSYGKNDLDDPEALLSCLHSIGISLHGFLDLMEYTIMIPVSYCMVREPTSFFLATVSCPCKDSRADLRPIIRVQLLIFRFDRHDHTIQAT